MNGYNTFSLYAQSLYELIGSKHLNLDKFLSRRIALHESDRALVSSECPCEKLAQSLIGFALQYWGVDLNFQGIAKPADDSVSRSIRDRLDFKTAGFSQREGDSGQPGEQLFVNAIKGTVAQHDNHIPLLNLGAELLHNDRGTWLMEGGMPFLLKVTHQKIDIESFLRLERCGTVHLSDDYPMGGCKGLGKIMLEDGAPGGVGAWFKKRPETASGIALCKSFEGLSDGSRMMAEVVDDRDPIHHTAHFLTALDPLELQERLADHRGRNALEMSC